MKKKDLVRYLQNNGCVFIREGARHSVFFNPQTKRASTIPRHNEINDFFSKEDLS